RGVVSMIRWHHERCDGGGYPDGIPRDAIPLEVRVLSVADVYDSLANLRPYRPAMPHPRCLEILRSDAECGGLDPDLVDVFCRMMESNAPGVACRCAKPDASSSAVLSCSASSFDSALS